MRRAAAHPPGRRRRPRRDNGFTLIEILAVIGVVVILMSLIIPAVGAVRRRAARDHTRATLLKIESAIHKHHLDFGVYPAGAGGLAGCEELYGALTTTEHSGPYWDEGDETDDTNGNGRPEIVDHWGRSLRYARADSYDFRPPKSQTYRLFSLGPDGRAGTDDDIRNWKDKDED